MEESGDTPPAVGMFNIVDSHTHLLDYSEKNIDAILSRAREANVRHIMSNCCVESDFEKMNRFLEKHSKDRFIIGNYGLHPWWLNDRSTEWLSKLRKELESNANSHVGEIGVDALKYEITSKEEQIEIFEQQLQLAIELDRIVSVHCVRAQPEVLKVFKKYFSKPSSKRINIIMHCYGGNKEMTKQYLKLHTDIYFSLSHGILKRPEFAECIPLSNVIIETDSPYLLSQEGVKACSLYPATTEFLPNDNPKVLNIDTLNEPQFVHIVVEFLAKLHSLSTADVAQTIFNNSLKALRLIK